MFTLFEKCNTVYNSANLYKKKKKKTITLFLIKIICLLDDGSHYLCFLLRNLNLNLYLITTNINIDKYVASHNEKILIEI